MFSQIDPLLVYVGNGVMNNTTTTHGQIVLCEPINQNSSK